MASDTMEKFRRYLWLFPFVAGTAWLSTLLVLLIYWVAAGRPRLPLQSNPYIAFISDIGAFHLKPLFVTGCVVTATGYMGTLLSIHHARYSPQMYGMDRGDVGARWRKVVSALALVSGLVACCALFLLAIFDTYKFHEIHGRLMFSCFAGLGTSMVTTCVVWFDQARAPSRYRRLRRWCVASNAIVLIEVVLGIAFTALMWTGHLRSAGILEWVITFMGGFYLLCFIGYLWKATDFAAPNPIKTDGERESLLAQSRG